MKTEKTKVTGEAEIRAAINGWAKALRTKDINALMTNYAPDVLSFDVVNPLQRQGRDEAKKRAEEWISSWQGPIECEISNLSHHGGQ
jgi:ketosteroid isomerase-like protein